MNNTADYLMGNSSNLTLVIITDNDRTVAQSEAAQRKTRPSLKQMLEQSFKVDASGRPQVQYNVFCALCGYLMNIPMFVLNLMFTVLMMARLEVIKADDPNNATLLYGNVSFMLSFVLMGYNALTWLTNWFLDGTVIDTILKWVMQLVVFGGLGLTGYYAFLNLMPIIADPMSAMAGIMNNDFSVAFEVLLIACYSVFQVLYVIGFWFYLCCF